MTESKRTTNYKRLFYTVAPLLLLIVCVVGINWVNWQVSRSQVADVVPVTAVSSQPSDNAATIAATPSPIASIALPTQTPRPTATPYEPPQFSIESSINLLGPPQDAAFFDQQNGSFYWQWPLELADDQYFSIVVIDAGDILELGRINEPNLGQHYYWQQKLSRDQYATDLLQWQVILFSEYSETPLLFSEPRMFVLR